MGIVITIGREFGSGGREFGKRLAEKLKIAYYDKEIIKGITDHTELSEKYVKNIIESKPYNPYPITIGHSMSYMGAYSYKQIQSVYNAQNDVINDLADKSDCVIIGRCADYILRDKNPYRIFIYADINKRVERCKGRAPEEENYSDKQLKRHIKEIDRKRKRFYDFYTGQKWGDKAYYDICINTSDVEIKDAVAAVARMFPKVD